MATSFNKYIFIASLSFLVLQFYNVVKRLTIDTNVSLDESVAVRGSSVSLDLPDIYYLIVDAYTSDASLKKYFSYSNDLNEQLKTRGFYCTSKGKSNYPLTYPSLASSLNMSYINSSEMILGFEGQEDLKKMIRANKLYNVLQANEYNLVNLSHIFNLNGPGSIPRKPESLAYTSIYQKAIFYPLLQRYVEQKIVQNMKRPGKSLADSDIRNDIAYIYYQYNNFVYKELAQDANLDTHPKFVFAHFMDTHAPFVYTATGTYKNDDYFFQTISDYLIQVEQLNKKLIDLVDILKKSQRKKVIIIQADHGSHLFGSQETFDIQNSYYFSDEDYKMLYPSISPVNTFRVVLNKYFGQNLEMLADNQVTLSY